MTWFWLALAATLCWSGADLFYKLGSGDKYDTLKTTAVVGLVFGLHALSTLVFGDISFDFRNLIRYLPVSAMYIGSMALGYWGLRYLELSVCSPVQNCSGALACLLGIAILREMPETRFALFGILACCVGVFLLGMYEHQIAQTPEERKYAKGFRAFALPIGYCILDTLGTFLDDPCLSMESTWLVGVTEDTIEEVGNTAYELTFFLVGVGILLYLLINNPKSLRPTRVGTLPRFGAAVLETAGQFAYVHVIGGNAVIAAPMISSYCIISVALSRIFLKERLPKRQYIAVTITLAGIVLIGIGDGLAGSV